MSDVYAINSDRAGLPSGAQPGSHVPDGGNVGRLDTVWAPGHLVPENLAHFREAAFRGTGGEAVAPKEGHIEAKRSRRARSAHPVAPASDRDWIMAWTGHRGRVIPVADVLYFQADTKYTRVVTADSEVLIRKPLKELLSELDASTFWIIHRSTIVNVRAIACVDRDCRGRITVQLKSRPDRLAVSDAHADRFRPT